VEEANNKAMELVETYGLWDQMSKNGDLITFKPGTLENIQKQQEQEINKAQSDIYASKIVTNTTRLKSDRTDLTRKIGNVVGTGIYNYETGQETTRQFSDAEIQEITTAFGNLQDAAEMGEA
jgi:hypothetical protein